MTYRIDCRVIACYLMILCATVIASAAEGATQTVARFSAINISLPHSQQGVGNVWEDVGIVSEFSAPSGHLFNEAAGDTIGGFYHSRDLWVVRFAPDEIGMWHYKITLTDRKTLSVFQDSFLCVASSEQGFIRVGEDYKQLNYSATGNLYSGVGFGDCMGATRDSILELGGIDGGYRPPGFHEGITWNLPYSQYLTAYGDVAGFNLYRYSDGNCAYSIVKQINESFNDYDTLHSRWTDTLFYALRQHGFRIYMTILAGPVGSSSNPKSMAAVERYAQYCIDRYGALVDFWELTNESSPDSLWISQVAGYITTHDPYKHLISVSWQQPNHPAIDIISPHWYGREDVRNSDQATADQINQYKDIRKPVIFGEQGEGGVWDSLSPTRVRARLWSALFNAGTIIFWNSSFAKDCACNQYLGWPERRTVRVLQNFAGLLSGYTEVRSSSTVGACKLWRYESQKMVALYIRNDQDVHVINSGLQFTVTVPHAGKAAWYDVHTGDVVGWQVINIGAATITAPNFQTDIAFIAGEIDSSLPPEKQFRLDVKPRTFEALNIPVNAQREFLVTVTNTGTDSITINPFTSSPSAKLILRAPQWKKPPTLAPQEKFEFPIGYEMIDTGGAAAMFSIEQTASPAWENIAFDVTAIGSSNVETIPKESEVEIAPDPASAYIFLRVRQGLPLKYEIYSAVAQRLLAGESHINSPIDIRSLPNGAYQVVVRSGTCRSILKLSVLR